MKRIHFILLSMVVFTYPMRAQDIRVTKFERNYTSLIASMDAVYDNTGEACAVIRFFVRDEAYEIEPNLGVLKRETRTGEIRLWVPIGTKKVTLRHQGAIPLNGYDIPVTLEPKVTYDAVVEITELPKPESSSNSSVYVGIGYNVMSISGLSVLIGGNFNHHILELGAIYGLSKTDDWYFYNSNGNVVSANKFQAIRMSLRYGYELCVSDYISFIPEIGGALNLLKGSDAAFAVKNSSYESTSSISALGALAIVLSFNEHIKMHVTPEYDFGVSKSNLCQLVSNSDSKFKSWTDGFSLNLGLMINF